MIKRIVEISQNACRLSVKYGQLIIKQDGVEVSKIPCEDIGVLLVDNPAVSYTHSVFTELLKYGAGVVFCGADHHPAGMLTPVDSHSTQTERHRYQIEAKEPLKKRLWQQIIKAKIRHQAKVLGSDSAAYQGLMALQTKVRSGDPDNIQAQASRKFWPCFMQHEKFKRDFDGGAPNNLLNYGYMVMRAAVARAICSAGLLPSLGLHHRNRYNSFCLADDLHEPFRGFVEAKVRDICSRHGAVEELGQDVKAELLSVLYDEVAIAEYKGPLMVGLHRTAASLVRCYSGEAKRLDLPEI
ncbi:MAG: type II CRISPR-associated endonuclease Cas1 [Phycisphaerae bacterium]|nr:type II CRISPR-associated endonuclease Cas1 [Phycisphaerae bacterium]